MGTYRPSFNYGPEHAAAQGGAAAAAKPKRELSEAQLAANRANAQKSTGPRTEEGKARVSHNATRHGLTGQINVLTEADRIGKEAFCNPIIEELKPQTPLEKQIATSIADDHYRLNRIRALEDNIFAFGHFTDAADIDLGDNAGNAELHSALTHARVFLARAKDFERLTLYAQRINRDIAKNMAQLEAIQVKRKAEREQALKVAAQLTRVGEPIPTDHPDGFVFAKAEIKAWIVRHERLREVEFREKHNWRDNLYYEQAA